MNYRERWIEIRQNPVFPFFPAFPIFAVILILVVIIWRVWPLLHLSRAPVCGVGAHWVQGLQTCVGDSNDAS